MSENKTTQVSTSTTQSSQELSILMQRVLGTDNTPEFTKEQVDELLSQKREVSKYIHEDKIRESKDSKFYIVIILLFVFAFSSLILFKRPELFSEVLSFLAGLFGGAFGGYGWSQRK